MFKTYVNASAGAGGTGMGPISSPSAGGGSKSGWSPSVLYMLGLLVAEIVAVGFISKHL